MKLFSGFLSVKAEFP